MSGDQNDGIDRHVTQVETGAVENAATATASAGAI